MHPLNPAAHRRIVALTGAGISVASGLRPYRGPGGLWTENPELARAATAQGSSADPTLPWRLFAGFREQVRAAAPNAAHVALAEFERRLSVDAKITIITQNIDGLHQRAGSRETIELHGSLERTRCSNPACTLEPFVDPTCTAEPPPCPGCGAPLRPDVVAFDEPLPAKAEWDSKRALRECDLFLAIGTSGTVSPASNFVRSAQYVGARTIYVNLEPLADEDSAFDEQVIGRAEDVLPRLLGVG
jgi:NAD-dependent deacetylase